VPDFASPLTLAPAAATGTRALTLTDLSALAKVQVRADPEGSVRDALGTGFGGTAHSPAGRPGDPVDLAGALVVGSGPGEWLVLAAPDATARVRAGLAALAGRADGFASVVDLTHGRALVRLTGQDAPSMLAKLCALDLSDQATPDGSAARSSVARVVTDLVRDDRPDGTRSYLLHCERSSGAYLTDCLLDAGAEFAIAVTAPDPTEADRP
jgi:heterotetrameric sarcosine oxidase gamma subunit